MNETNTTNLPAVAGAPALPAWMAGLSGTLSQAMEVGKFILDSGFAPPSYKTPQAVVVAIAMGARLGLDPFSSLAGIAVINNRASIWGDSMLAVCQNHPQWGDFSEEWIGNKYDDTYHAVCSVVRKGRQPVVNAFSVSDAKRQGCGPSLDRGQTRRSAC